MILSILIPTLSDRKRYLNEMLTNISEQIEKNNAWGKVEVLIDERDRSFSTGSKRNSLLKKSKGKYVWFVDDDDYIWPYAIEEILRAAEKDPDVIGINGIMTTDGSKQVDWEIRLGHPYKAIQKNGREYYLRFPNHITPMKREHAIKIKFPNKFTFEDYEWADSMNKAGYLKTQEIIEKPIYHYKCRTKKIILEMYSQNQEERHIVNYFKDFKGTLLDIGANDGKTFSNSLRLIESGWKAYLVEPSPKAFDKLLSLHSGKENVECIQVAIGEKNCKSVLHESGWHLHHRSDIALVSTLKKEETKRWKNVAFNDSEVEVMDYKTFLDLIEVREFDFITIDAEGMDWEILSQIDLTNCKMLCVETNSIDTEKYINYCKEFGMRLIYKNSENIIMVK